MKEDQNWSISSLVRTLVKLDPCVYAGISSGYVNLSALARILKPTVENYIGRSVKLDAIVTSLKRLDVKQTNVTYPIAKIIARSRLNLKSDLAKLAVKRNLKTRQIVKEASYKYRRTFIQVIEGFSSITLIYNEKLHSSLKKLFLRKHIIEESSGLVALMMISPQEIITTPGPLALILSQLVNNGINVEEIISCYTDTLIIIKGEDGGKAFDALSELIQRCRHILNSQIKE